MILAVAMVFTMVSTTALVSAKESSFNDVVGTASEWANEYIEKMVEKGILDGVGGGKFEPSALLTREQFAKVLVAGIPKEDKGITAEFDDVKEESGFIIEPNGESAVEATFDFYLQSKLVNCILNAKTSEESSRMTAMDGATKNADDLLDSLNTKYNRIRQSAITQEIAEIVGGAAAQK